MKAIWSALVGAWRKGKFYIALGLFILALGGAAYWLRNRPGEQGPQPLESAAPVGAQGESVQSLADVEQQGIAWSWPLARARVLTPFSPHEPIWSDTLEQFCAHDGLDLAAVRGEVVFAAADGEVTRAYASALLGNVLEIAHEGGYVSTYASLETSALVTPGERVWAGQAIASAGDSARGECALGAHLHFAIAKDGAPIDPGELCQGTAD